MFPGWQGLHRTLHQVLSRAPNAGPAYVSTESRIQLFDKIFASPIALANMAERNEDLTTTKGLALAIAHLVGGSACQPVGSCFKFHQLTSLLYGLGQKYTRGGEAALVLKHSVPETLRKNKCLGLVDYHHKQI